MTSLPVALPPRIITDLPPTQLHPPPTRMMSDRDAAAGKNLNLLEVIAVATDQPPTGRFNIMWSYYERWALFLFFL